MALTLLKAQELGRLPEGRLRRRGGGRADDGAGPAAAGAAAPAAEAEKEDFTVVLTGSGDKKIQVIKVVRELTGLGLKEAKDLVDGAPKTVKEDVPKAQAEEMKKKIEEAGGTVELK